MIRTLYRALLRGPRFRGRHRLEAMLRGWLAPARDRAPEGLVMELDAQEWLQIHLLGGEELEPATIALIKRLLLPGDTMIDVGSHVGFHALVAAGRVGPGGRVIALDPQPYNCERVLINAELNGLNNLLMVGAAAGPRDGTVVLRNQKRNDKARLTLAGEGVSDVAIRFEAPVVALDSLMARHGVTAIRLLKIDVEGYEAEVLDGAAATLAMTENLVFECLPETDPAVVARIMATLEAAGFSLKQLDGAAWRPGQVAPEHNIWAVRAPERQGL